MWTIELAVMAVMIGFNSIFAGYEIALASVGLARLDTLVKEKSRGAAAAWRMKQNMEGSLAVVQLGITLVATIAAATGGAGAEESIAPRLQQIGLSPTAAQLVAIAAVVAPLTVVTIIFGELVPKVFSLRNKEWVCLRLSGPMEWFSYAVWPAVRFLEGSVNLVMRLFERRWNRQAADGSQRAALQELRAIAAIARTSRLIGVREERIILSAARISSTPIRSIMLPAEDISMLHADSSLADALIAVHQDMHTRFPVTEQPGDPQQIVGYANFKDIVACLHVSPDCPSLRSIIRRLPRMDAEMSVATCLEQLIRDYTHIALVINAEGAVIGMVTMEDVLEELVGEIGDEYDRLPSQMIPVGNGWIVGGNATLSQLQTVTGIELRVDKDQNLWTIDQLDPAASGAIRPSEEISCTKEISESSSAKSGGNPCRRPS